MRQRERLIDRVKQIRVAGANDQASGEPATPPAAASVDELEHRVAHLEQQLRGLQDSVHRVNVSHAAQLADLAARVEPAALAVALETDARERGL